MGVLLFFRMDVDDRMLGELVAMGFSKTLAAKALSSSGTLLVSLSS